LKISFADFLSSEEDGGLEQKMHIDYMNNSGGQESQKMLQKDLCKNIIRMFTKRRLSG